MRPDHLISTTKRQVKGNTATLYADGLPVPTANNITLALDVTIEDVTPTP